MYVRVFSANIAVYRDQLSELAADLKNGIIAQSQCDQDREEIEPLAQELRSKLLMGSVNSRAVISSDEIDPAATLCRSE